MSEGDYVGVGNYFVHPALHVFVEQELLPGLSIDARYFWQNLERLIDTLTPENRRLLTQRHKLQSQIDDYHRARTGKRWDPQEYRLFLKEIGYIEEAGGSFRISTSGVDREIAEMAGPQLVVPLTNARFALNAVNARWGSLYDVLYGTDVISVEQWPRQTGAYNPRRGSAVVRYCETFLDDIFPLLDASHSEVKEYSICVENGRGQLIVKLSDGWTTSLKRDDQFIGVASGGTKTDILLRNNDLHVILRLDPTHPVGRTAPAGVSDLLLESALTVILDCEDSVAVVDAEDKVQLYRNCLRLMRGTLSTTFCKSGHEVCRKLNEDRQYTAVDGAERWLPGRSVMLVRNVGHHMTTNAVVGSDGTEVFEGLLDAVITVACGLYDLKGIAKYRNSAAGSIYVVKPKMHGSREAAFANHLLDCVEDLFGLERYTVKIGLMDEERRTSVNLEECIRNLQHRLAFINTGFLDRTGDEIYTSSRAGPVLPKESIKFEPWYESYEDRNVEIGVRCGLPGKAQIGKGMWPKPDRMSDMVKSKLQQLQSGATCGWVPSPTAATLHAMHYHMFDVNMCLKSIGNREPTDIEELLRPPLASSTDLSPKTIQREIDSNVQSILGYVVRWIDRGVGCSKVPDINGVGLMEDRATLRISSQLLANWLAHGVCNEQQIREAFCRMAVVVDEQNRGDPRHVRLSPHCNSVAFQTALDLVLKGTLQPNGYTEALLHRARRMVKRAAESETAERETDVTA